LLSLVPLRGAIAAALSFWLLAGVVLLVLEAALWSLTGVVFTLLVDGDSVTRALAKAVALLTVGCGLVCILLIDVGSVMRALAIDIAFILVADGDSVARVLAIIAGLLVRGSTGAASWAGSAPDVVVPALAVDILACGSTRAAIWAGGLVRDVVGGWSGADGLWLAA
jgi:hypothetical protein